MLYEFILRIVLLLLSIAKVFEYSSGSLRISPLFWPMALAQSDKTSRQIPLRVYNQPLNAFFLVIQTASRYSFGIVNSPSPNVLIGITPPITHLFKFGARRGTKFGWIAFELILRVLIHATHHLTRASRVHGHSSRSPQHDEHDNVGQIRRRVGVLDLGRRRRRRLVSLIVIRRGHGCCWCCLFFKCNSDVSSPRINPPAARLQFVSFSVVICREVYG